MAQKQTKRKDGDDLPITIAIDFGATYSGYAYSFKNDPSNVVLNDPWGVNVGTSTFKTPTAVLTDKDKQFVAFGYDAKFAYKDKKGTSEEKPKNYIYDECFKMKLYYAEDPFKYIVDSRDGKQNIILSELISMTLDFLYRHSLVKLTRTYPWVQEHLVKVILTIPTIWDKLARDSMKKIAAKIGITPNRMVFALESDAASFYCRTLPISAPSSTTPAKLQLSKGTGFMVIDCGGGTVDIAFHKAVDDTAIAEVYAPIGGAYGGNQVNEKFENLLDKIIGKEFMRKYKNLHPLDWFQIYTEFEYVKRQHSEQRIDYTIAFPYSIIHAYKKGGLVSFMNRNIERKIKKGKVEGVEFKQGKLMLPKKVIDDLFPETINNIMSVVKESLQFVKLCKVKYIFLVGGFADCNLLFERIKTEIRNTLPDVYCIKPDDPVTAVLKGAVRYGHDLR